MSWREEVEQAVPAQQHVLHSAALTLAPEPANVRQARRFVCSVLSCPEGDCLDVLELLTSELVTNAVIHARTRLEVVVVLTEDLVVVLVHDEDLGRTELRTHDRDGGRGLELVGALASCSGLTYHPHGGKTAWFALDRAGVGAAG